MKIKDYEIWTPKKFFELYQEIFESPANGINAAEVLFVFGAGIDIGGSGKKNPSGSELNKKMIEATANKEYSEFLFKKRTNKNLNQKLLGQFGADANKFQPEVKKILNEALYYEVKDSSEVSDINKGMNTLKINLLTTNYTVPKLLHNPEREIFSNSNEQMIAFTRQINGTLFFHGSLEKDDIVYANSHYSELYARLKQKKTISSLKQSFKRFKIVLFFGMSLQDVDFLNLISDICANQKKYFFNTDYSEPKDRREIINQLTYLNFGMSTIFYKKQHLNFMLNKMFLFMLENEKINLNGDIDEILKKGFSAIKTKSDYLAKLKKESESNYQITRINVFGWRDGINKLEDLKILPSFFYKEIGDARTRGIFTEHFFKSYLAKKLSVKQFRIVVAHAMQLDYGSTQIKNTLSENWERYASDFSNSLRKKVVNGLIPSISEIREFNIGLSDFLLVSKNKNQYENPGKKLNLKNSEELTLHQLDITFKKFERLDKFSYTELDYKRQDKKENFAMQCVTAATKFINEIDKKNETYRIKSFLLKNNKKVSGKGGIKCLFFSQIEKNNLSEYGFENSIEQIETITFCLPEKIKNIKTGMGINQKFMGKKNYGRQLDYLLISGANTSVVIEKINQLKEENLTKKETEYLKFFHDALLINEPVSINGLSRRAFVYGFKEINGIDDLDENILTIAYWKTSKITDYDLQIILDAYADNQLKDIDIEIKETLDCILNFEKEKKINNVINVLEKNEIINSIGKEYLLRLFVSQEKELSVFIENTNNYLKGINKHKLVSIEQESIEKVFEKKEPYYEYSNGFSGLIISMMSKFFVKEKYEDATNLNIFNDLLSVLENLPNPSGGKDIFVLKNTYSLGLKKSIEIIKNKLKALEGIILLTRCISIGRNFHKELIKLIDLLEKNSVEFKTRQLDNQCSQEICFGYLITKAKINSNILENKSFFEIAIFQFFKLTNEVDDQSVFFDSILEFVKDNNKCKIEGSNWQIIKPEDKNFNREKKGQILNKLMEGRKKEIEIHDYIHLAHCFDEIEKINDYLMDFRRKCEMGFPISEVWLLGKEKTSLAKIYKNHFPKIKA